MAGTSESDHRGRPSANYCGEDLHLEDLAGLLGRIARELDTEKTLDETMQALVTAAVAAIPGAEAGGITEVHGRGQRFDVRFASDQLVRDLDAAQEALRQGPCLEAAYRHRTVRVNDFQTDERWPAFAARAREAGISSMLAIQLYVDGDDLGALNLYAHRPRAFDDESEQIGLLFATHAAIAMAGVQRERQLRVAISSRDIIGQAKGILMERYKLTAEQAFAVLTRASSESNIKLRKVAEALATTGDEPGS